MHQLDMLKVLKITVGCCLAIALSMWLGLQYSTAAGVITLLSIQNTKKETLLVAVKRLGAYVVAVIIAYVCFEGIGYNLGAFGVYLLFFISFCVYFKIPEAMAICTVLVAHFWVEQNMTWAFILNETGLITIGVGIGILFNLFMPPQIKAIRQEQRNIENTIRGILEELSVVILGKIENDSITFRIENLKEMLQSARAKAYDQMNNTLGSDMRYYVQYIDMRNQQIPVMKRIYHQMGKLQYVPKQAHRISTFIENVALTFHEYNNAVALLREVEEIRVYFKEDALPTTRDEFEVRAVLFQIINDLEYFLMIKKSFIEALTEEQMAIFWPATTNQA